jgi:DUF971 family protein
MKLKEMTVINDFLALKWDDESESIIPLRTLRENCPCAGCQGEVDALGKLHRGPAPKLTERSFQLRSLQAVGGYGLQPVWGDGHSTGIFSLDMLRRYSE